MIGVLRAHIRRYPKMELADALKLLYQSEFAGGHLIKSDAESFARLEQESLTAQPCPAFSGAFEDIGGGLCRAHMARTKALGIGMQTLHRLFAATARFVRGSTESFEQKLSIIYADCAAGTLPFSAEDLKNCLDKQRTQGWPPVSHSAAYRAAYAPAYRIVKADYCRYIKAFADIDNLLSKKPFVTVAIDGPSGAGKSTLAALFRELYSCSVLHMDDFFLPPPRKTPERLLEPGGNIDHERFLNEVLEPLKCREPFAYRVYNCKEDRLSAPVPLSPSPLCIVEGVYSLHPRLLPSYDYRIFLDADRETQSARILARSGQELHGRFVQEWIPLENKYFAAFDIKKQCVSFF